MKHSDRYSSFWDIPEDELIKDINSLKLEESLFLPYSDYGHGIITLSVKGYELYSIPAYGGDPIYETTVSTIEESIKEVGSWI